MKHLTNRAFLGAYRKGRKAAESGELKRCPYGDKRGGKFGQIVTYSRSFQNFWNEGYEDAKAGTPERYASKDTAIAVTL